MIEINLLGIIETLIAGVAGLALVFGFIRAGIALWTEEFAAHGIPAAIAMGVVITAMNVLQVLFR